VFGGITKRIYPNPSHVLYLYFHLHPSCLWRFVEAYKVKRESIKEIYYEHKGTGPQTVERYAPHWNEKEQHWIWHEEDFKILH